MPKRLRGLCLAAALALFLLPRGCVSVSNRPALPTRGLSLEVTARPIPLDSEDPSRSRVGRLTYRGGLELDCPDEHFGGFSGLLISPDGRDLLAVSDHGWWLTAGLAYGPAGDLSGLGRARLGPIIGTQGFSYEHAAYLRDAEELSRGKDDSVLVSFELVHRVNTFRAPGNPFSAGAVESVDLPQWLRPAPKNSGVEAMTDLPGGRLLLVAEGLWGAGEVLRGALWQDGAWHRISYQPTPGFKPTAAASLPNGDALFLERHFGFLSGLRVRVVLAAAGQIKPGGIITPRLLAELAPPLASDNFEGIDARQDAAGRTLVYIISDDNYSPLQRTLLLMFELTAPQ